MVMPRGEVIKTRRMEKAIDQFDPVPEMGGFRAMMQPTPVAAALRRDIPQVAGWPPVAHGA
jgi:hypothetical protein